jgi:hypothetical protein
MNCWDVIEQIEAVKKSDGFVEYQKDFANFLTFTLLKEYPRGEVPSVKAFDNFQFLSEPIKEKSARESNKN